MRTILTRTLTTVATAVVVAFSAPACSSDARVAAARPTGIPLPPHVEVPSHDRDVTQLALSPDGRILASVSADSIHLWNTADMSPRTVIDDVDKLEFNRGVAVANDGRYVAVIDSNDRLVVWDRNTQSSRVVEVRYMDTPTELIGFARDDSLFWISHQGVVKWKGTDDPESKRDSVFEIADVNYGATSRQAGDEKYLVWSRFPGLLRVDDTGRARLDPIEVDPRDLPHPSQAPVLVGGADSTRLFMLTGGTAGIYDVERAEASDDDRGTAWRRLSTRRTRGRQGVGEQPMAMAASADGTTIALAYRSGGVEIWDLERAELVATLHIGQRWVRDVHPRPVLDMTLSEDALWLLLPEQTLLRVARDGWVIADDFEL